MHQHTAVFRSVPPSMLANIHRLQVMKSRLHLPRWDPQRGCDECRYAWISVGWKTDQGLRWLWWGLSPIQPSLVWECVCVKREEKSGDGRGRDTHRHRRNRETVETLTPCHKGTPLKNKTTLKNLFYHFSPSSNWTKMISFTASLNQSNHFSAWFAFIFQLFCSPLPWLSFTQHNTAQHNAHTCTHTKTYTLALPSRMVQWGCSLL